MGVVYRSGRCLPSHPYPSNLKEVPTVLPQFSSVPIHLPPFQPTNGPTGLYNDCEGEADGLHKGSQTAPIPGRLAYQVPIPGGGTSEHSDSP